MVCVRGAWVRGRVNRERSVGVQLHISGLSSSLLASYQLNVQLTDHPVPAHQAIHNSPGTDLTSSSQLARDQVTE